jgi:hypothetical protein
MLLSTSPTDEKLIAGTTSKLESVNRPNDRLMKFCLEIFSLIRLNISREVVEKFIRLSLYTLEYSLKIILFMMSFLNDLKFQSV